MSAEDSINVFQKGLKITYDFLNWENSETGEQVSPGVRHLPGEDAPHHSSH